MDFEELGPVEPSAAPPAEKRRARREALRRAHRRRRLTALGTAGLLLATALALAAWRPWTGGPRSHPTAGVTTTQHAVTARGAGANRKAATTAPRAGGHVPEPAEVRGVHVSHYVAGDPVRMRRFYQAADVRTGLNALQIDVKDEAGIVGFDAHVPLARRVGAVERLFDPVAVVRAAHKAGLYVIGRVVMFEDPRLAKGAPDHAIRRRDGGVWTNAKGLGWTNPYDHRVWQYGIDLGKAAGRAGFDEIQFDYVRFPTDGDIGSAVFRGRLHEPYDATINRFLRTAVAALHPLGLKVSADMFGLAATTNLHIGQIPRRVRNVLDAVSPMAYPSHYGPGVYGIPNPNAAPYRTMNATLRDWKRTLRGGHVHLRPWVQDFSLGVHYGPAEVRAQIRAVRQWTHSGFLLWDPSVRYESGVLTS